MVVHGAAQSKNECTNFLNGMFRHYAFPIKNLKLIQTEPIENPKTYPSLDQSEYSFKPIHFIQAQPIRMFFQTYTFDPSSANQNILLTCCRKTFQDNGDL